VWPEGLGKFKNSPHQVSNPLPSGLYHSALTTTLPRTQAKVISSHHPLLSCPSITIITIIPLTFDYFALAVRLASLDEVRAARVQLETVMFVSIAYFSHLNVL
jgi:hypothetical protein